MGTWSEMTCEEEQQLQRPRGELMGASGQIGGRKRYFSMPGFSFQHEKCLLVVSFSIILIQL